MQRGVFGSHTDYGGPCPSLSFFFRGRLYPYYLDQMSDFGADARFFRQPGSFVACRAVRQQPSGRRVHEPTRIR